MPVDFVIIYPPASLAKYSPTKILPLGGLYLADSLLKQGYSIAIVDDNIESIKKSIDNLIGNQTIAFGISTLSGTQLKNAISIAKFLRVCYPDKPIIWGGVHITALPLQTLQSELVDFIVWGEGEESLPKLLKAIKSHGDLSQIKGIGYKEKGKAIITENSGYTKIDKKVFKLPYYLLNMENYQRKMLIGLNRCFTVFSSRGCPFRCKFCSNSNSIWPNTKMRYHSLEHIINDIDILVREYNADGITFADENFFVDEQRLIDICQALQKRKFNIKFRTSARADLLSKLTENTWELLKDSGFIGITVGIESGSQRVLDFIGKGITLDEIYRVDDLLTRYNFYKTYNFMTCVPGETIDDLRETLRLILYLSKTSRYCPYPFGELNKFIPLPGTELFNIAMEYGFRPPNTIEGWVDFDLVNTEGTVETVRPWLSNELLLYVNNANRLIEELNSLYVGNDSNNPEINLLFEKIESLIN